MVAAEPRSGRRIGFRRGPARRCVVPDRGAGPAGGLPRIAELTVGVYVDGGLAYRRPTRPSSPTSPAGPRARTCSSSATPTAGLVGSVALVLSGDFGEVTTSDEEAAFRMLVVDPAAQGQGIGELLVTTCLDRARAAGKRRMVISTDPRMTAAHRLYERMGFTPAARARLAPDARRRPAGLRAGPLRVSRATTVAMRSPSWRTSPSTTCRSCTVPARSVSTGISIFIDSRITSVSPAATWRPARRGPSRRWRPSPRGSPRPPPGLLCARRALAMIIQARRSAGVGTGRSRRPVVPDRAAPRAVVRHADVGQPASASEAARAAVAVSGPAALTVASSASYQPSSRSPGS